MSLTTHSKFYFGHTVDASNNKVDFKEGATAKVGTLSIGEYTLAQFATELARALTAAGGQTYAVAVNRTTRVLTISAASTFSLLVGTGGHAGTSGFTLAGFTGGDRTATNSYAGNAGSGSAYATQFILQDHVPSDHYQSASEATVNKSASGKRVEVFSFGEESFMECNFKFVTDKNVTGSVIRNSPTGVADLLAFFRYLKTKAPVEFMADEATPTQFQSLMVESFPDDKNGVGFKLKELYDKGLPGFYESGILKFRVVD